MTCIHPKGGLPVARNENLWQIIKFTLFSASAGIIQVASFAVLETVFHLPYWPSYLTSLILSVLWNFTFNRRYTFCSDANVPRAMALVAVFYVIFTPLSTWGGDALTKAGWNDFLVLALTMILNFVLEYLYQRFVVYRGMIDTNDVARRAGEQKK
ncbi:MAG: GtrA family protein [Clostridia bacterium]|nr:GtrA family protein [Clostridia bacterium]